MQKRILFCPQSEFLTEEEQRKILNYARKNVRSKTPYSILFKIPPLICLVLCLKFGFNKVNYLWQIIVLSCIFVVFSAFFLRIWFVKKCVKDYLAGQLSENELL